MDLNILNKAWIDYTTANYWIIWIQHCEGVIFNWERERDRERERERE